MYEPVEDHVLEAFISKKFHWKSLQPHHQMALAIEVMRLRYLLKKHYDFIEEVLEHKEAAKRYRELVTMQEDDECQHYWIQSPSGEVFCYNCNEVQP